MATVRDPSPRVVELSQDWDLISDLMGGTRAMRHAGKRHLPQWPAEDRSSYDIRLATSVLFPAYSRTVSVLTSKPFSKEITIVALIKIGCSRISGLLWKRRALLAIMGIRASRTNR